MLVLCYNAYKVLLYASNASIFYSGLTVLLQSNTCLHLKFCPDLIKSGFHNPQSGSITFSSPCENPFNLLNTPEKLSMIMIQALLLTYYVIKPPLWSCNGIPWYTCSYQTKYRYWNSYTAQLHVWGSFILTQISISNVGINFEKTLVLCTLKIIQPKRNLH